MSEQLFQLVFNRLSRAKQIEPKFIGKFHGVEALPKGDYPPIYYWVDMQLGGSVRLSFNTPLLMDMCSEEAQHAGIQPDERTSKQAVAFLENICTGAFQRTINQMQMMK